MKDVCKIIGCNHLLPLLGILRSIANYLTALLRRRAYANRMVKSPTITRFNTHGHAAFLYNTSDERFELIAQYFKEGLDNNELCVFVTADNLDHVAKKFMGFAFDVSGPIRSGALRIFEMNDTYLPDGRFAADYMLANVSNYIEEAKSLGYSGLRTAGEMSWIYDHPEFNAEAQRYEEQVNRLGEQNPNFIGLCLYPVQDHFAKVLHDVSDTHPSFIYDGHPQLNPHYQPV